ncbi:hypothetical protein [Candidatus Leptofilum sp.]|uniref:hypothetical protein n=1 Tax=Candidatus Leptofilum sp. TaxID=3241576 RepID=UPI003B5A3BF9
MNITRSLKSLFSRFGKWYAHLFSKSNLAGKIGLGCSTILILFCSCGLGITLVSNSQASEGTGDDLPAISSRLDSENPAGISESDSPTSSAVADEEELPSQTPTSAASPTEEPTASSTATLTVTLEPTATNDPTETPTNTAMPTNTQIPPTSTAIVVPTAVPTQAPTEIPTTVPTLVPTVAPVTPTEAPTIPPTEVPAGPSLPPPSFNNCQADPNASIAPNFPVRITNINDSDETVTLMNVSNEAIDLNGWQMCSIKGNQLHQGIGGVLGPGAQQTYPYTGSGNIWSNSDKDDGALYNSNGQLVSYWND